MDVRVVWNGLPFVLETRNEKSAVLWNSHAAGAERGPNTHYHVPYYCAQATYNPPSDESDCCAESMSDTSNQDFSNAYHLRNIPITLSIQSEEAVKPTSQVLFAPYLKPGSKLSMKRTQDEGIIEHGKLRSHINNTGETEHSALQVLWIWILRDPSFSSFLERKYRRFLGSVFWEDIFCPRTEPTSLLCFVISSRVL